MFVKPNICSIRNKAFTAGYSISFFNFMRSEKKFDQKALNQILIAY